MARLSEKSMLAIAAVVDVALHARGQPVAAKALADRHGLPPRHLEPVLQSLVHAGILKGVRGPRKQDAAYNLTAARLKARWTRVRSFDLIGDRQALRGQSPRFARRLNQQFRCRG
jgi:hypothetical protein